MHEALLSPKQSEGAGNTTMLLGFELLIAGCMIDGMSTGHRVIAPCYTQTHSMGLLWELGR